MVTVNRSSFRPNGQAKASNEELAKVAKALGHPARIAILQMLLSRKTCVGCDIADRVGLAASTTSEHLRILKEAGLIRGEIEHPRVCYALVPGSVAALVHFLDTIIDASKSLPLENTNDRV